MYHPQFPSAAAAAGAVYVEIYGGCARRRSGRDSVQRADACSRGELITSTVSAPDLNESSNYAEMTQRQQQGWATCAIQSIRTYSVVPNFDEIRAVRPVTCFKFSEPTWSVTS